MTANNKLLDRVPDLASEHPETMVQQSETGELTTTSLVIAEGTGNDHASIIKLVRGNIADFEEFQRVGFQIRPFETAGGVQKRSVAVLNRDQALLLITYMRNNELIPVHTNPDGGNVVMGRDLHEFLEVTTRYNDWMGRLIKKYGFVAGQDFYSKMSKSSGGRRQEDHIITLDMAKELSMVQNNDRGRQARQYFIECERRLKQVQPELTPEQLMAKDLPCSRPYLTIRLKPIIVVVSFYKDLNQARFTRGKLGQCIEPRSRSRRPRGF
ncbi:antA/AntB antirepressor family protein [Corynebacterium sp. EPI-003-04-2554_SCH2473622]|uniref:antA/AntB antirepressor family protein n=1 Tax=Corynebacterium sp. EPI-003-04-2554_SCH2473622 TaxID=1834153 RepID=UPI0007EAF334|nr:antA/AntB antirepressor family protein [Corynebacterium sp. EPI-003-04-2554_SCH2473622]OBA52341.1 hypothetical protein A5774_09160 [Corynebacterium sp. EPI-003-04-2554_SCH2473622]